MYWLYFTRHDGHLTCGGSFGTQYRQAINTARDMVQNGTTVARVVRVNGNQFTSVVRFYRDPSTFTGYGVNWGPARWRADGARAI